MRGGHLRQVDAFPHSLELMSSKRARVSGLCDLKTWMQRMLVCKEGEEVRMDRERQKPER